MPLHDVTDHAAAIDPGEVADPDRVEDYREIADVEPGRIWFEGGVGPIRATQGDRPRPARLVGVRDGRQDRGELASARGRRRLSPTPPGDPASTIHGRPRGHPVAIGEALRDLRKAVE